jgi:DNA modification methylase
VLFDTGPAPAAAPAVPVFAPPAARPAPADVPRLLVADSDVELWHGDAAETLARLPAGSAHAVATSPPFWGLRDYRAGAAELGGEPTPQAWAEAVADVLDGCRRVLRRDGSLWAEVGDTYVSGSKGRDRGDDGGAGATGLVRNRRASARVNRRRLPAGYREKSLAGTPFLLALELCRRGWTWRETIIWEKPNAMPSSADDRCTVAHSYVLRFTHARYYFDDGEALAEPVVPSSIERARRGTARYERPGASSSVPYAIAQPTVRADGLRRPRSVWSVLTGNDTSGWCKPCGMFWPDRAPLEHCGVQVVAHRAVWTPELVARIIRVATPEGGACTACGKPWRRELERGWRPACGCEAPAGPAVVVDPFAGVGTLAVAARELGRRAVLVELNRDYCELARRKLAQLSVTGELVRAARDRRPPL